ncbi:MAG TPA: AI-2E family transporter [Gemmatimonadaceae bacterium]|jgi:predicted PurR-regulated permease PerM|nr:AI-2E family transporter [Gemmatimonadaceae bacterium]
MRVWDARAARITLTVAIVAATLYGVYVIRRTLFVFLLAIFFAYMVYPLVVLLDRFRPRRAPPWASPVAALVLVLALVVLIGILIGPSIGDEATRLSEQLPALLQRGDAMATERWPAFLQPYAGRIVAFARTELQGGAAAALPLAQRIGAGVLQVAGDLLLLVLIPILAFLFTLAGPEIRQMVERSLARRAIDQSIVDDLDNLLGRYIRALLLLSVAAFAAYAVVLASIGVPYALLLATIAALLEFIPVFGPLLSALAIILVAGLAGYPHLIWILIFIVGYRIFQDYVLGPRLMGTGVGVHPILVLFGLLAGAEVAGVPGIFLSVPAIAAVLIIGRHVLRARAKSKDEKASL